MENDGYQLIDTGEGFGGWCFCRRFKAGSLIGTYWGKGEQEIRGNAPGDVWFSDESLVLKVSTSTETIYPHPSLAGYLPFHAIFWTS